MGTRENRLGEAVLTSTHNLCFEQKYEKYQNFYVNIFSYLEVKFSTYLNRCVFVMVTNEPANKRTNDPKANVSLETYHKEMFYICRSFDEFRVYF